MNEAKPNDYLSEGSQTYNAAELSGTSRERLRSSESSKCTDPLQAASLGQGGSSQSFKQQTVRRPSLLELVQKQRGHAQQEAQHAEQLAELQFLLEANPTITRILDLLDYLRYKVS